jgi:hypothetical protein
LVIASLLRIFDYLFWVNGGHGKAERHGPDDAQARRFIPRAILLYCAHVAILRPASKRSPMRRGGRRATLAE